ncbi:unnamed protein product [Microthlaspi erraticum]|uniref:Uncharacterized protein n=1 Tax=Microthlaspi erraticum TaxID=1685480 RepID=A0A6D2L0T0_9BRAS|nr:unnamed protein product [Microthlaspi erraticum]
MCPNSRVVAESERSWPDGFTVGRRGRTDEIWPMISRPDVGRSFPARTDASAVVRGRVARPRGLFPARALVVRGVACVWLGRPRDMFPGSCCVIGRSVWNFGRDFSRTDVTLAERETFVSRPAGLRGLGADSR